MAADEASDDQVDWFNEWIYSGDPADYLRTRLQLLVLAGSKPQQLAELVGQSVSWAGITIGDPADALRGGEVDPIDVDDLDKFLTLEAVLLLHHAAETVLRLYVAHADTPAAPAVGIASRKRPGEFKAEVHRRFIAATPSDDQLGFVCLGNVRRPDDVEPDEWTDVMAGLAAFLRLFAEVFLDDAPIYNAMKHGFAAAPGRAELLVGQIRAGHGSSITIPVYDDWIGDERRWYLETRWIGRTRTVAQIVVATAMIDSIWRIGRTRTTPEDRRPTGHDGLFYPRGLRPSDLRSDDTGGAHRLRMPYIAEQRFRPTSP